MKLKSAAWCVLWTGLFLQPVLGEPVTIGETETLQSKILDEERQLMIHLPAGYETSGESYPVMYLLDPRGRFHHTTGTLSALARNGEIPNMIVVGVVNTDRTRDLTPPWTRTDSEQTIERRLAAIEAGGGANNFLSFLKNELIPHVDRTYRTTPFRMLVGHSFGGLFAVHSLVTEPDLFSATLSISPSLWWDEGLSVEQTRDLFKARPDLKHRLFLTLADEGGDMVEQFRNMQTVLKYEAPESLSWHAEVYDGETHSTIPMPSVYSGLRFFFPRWQVPPFALRDGLEAIDRHFASLSEDYGYPMSAPESTINNLGYQTMGEGKVEQAIEIFKVNVERFPESANVYDSLGEAMEAGGRLQEAMRLFNKAFDLGTRAADPNAQVYKSHADAVRRKIAEGSGV